MKIINSVKLFLTHLTYFSFFFTAYAAEQNKLKEIRETYQLIGVEKTLQIFAEEMRKKNGRKIDENTTQFNVIVDKNSLNALIELNLLKKNLNLAVLEDKLRLQVIKNTCAIEINRIITDDLGGVLAFHYFDKNREKLFVIDIAKNNCQSKF